MFVVRCPLQKKAKEKQCRAMKYYMFIHISILLFLSNVIVIQYESIAVMLVRRVLKLVQAALGGRSWRVSQLRQYGAKGEHQGACKRRRHHQHQFWRYHQ